VNSLPKTVTRQRRDCDLNLGPSAPESSTLNHSAAVFSFSVSGRLVVGSVRQNKLVSFRAHAQLAYRIVSCRPTPSQRAAAALQRPGSGSCKRHLAECPTSHVEVDGVQIWTVGRPQRAKNN